MERWALLAAEKRQGRPPSPRKTPSRPQKTPGAKDRGPSIAPTGPFGPDLLGRRNKDRPNPRRHSDTSPARTAAAWCGFEGNTKDTQDQVEMPGRPCAAGFHIHLAANCRQCGQQAERAANAHKGGTTWDATGPPQCRSGLAQPWSVYLKPKAKPAVPRQRTGRRRALPTWYTMREAGLRAARTRFNPPRSGPALPPTLRGPCFGAAFARTRKNHPDARLRRAAARWGPPSGWHA